MKSKRYRDVLVRTGRLVSFARSLFGRRHGGNEKHGRASNTCGLAASGATFLLLGVVSSGCFIEEGRPRRAVEVEPTLPSPAPSKLVVRWSIDGKRDPNECVKATASDIEVSVFDGGRELGAWRQRCDAFAISITLNPGDYSGSALLLDAYRRARTTTVTIDPFTLRGNDTLEVPVNFPASSFLQQ